MPQDHSESELEIRRKRLRFRAWHRGTQELDLIMGPFADRFLAGFDAGELDQFESLLQLPDPMVYDWVAGRSQPPCELESPVLRQLFTYVKERHRHDAG